MCLARIEMTMLMFYSSNELQNIFAESGDLTDSPDLGPPPIAHFQEEDPIKFDAAPIKKPDQIDTETVPTLSANLETRKRRRESSHHREPNNTRDTNDPMARSNPYSAKPVAVPALKSGAKRKLNIRNEEDRSLPDQTDDDNRYSGKSVESDPKTGKSKTDLKAPSTQSKSTLSKGFKEPGPQTVPKETSTSMTTRKVLGPKSVNSDPQSPAKLAKFASTDKPVNGKDEIVKRIRDRNQGRDKQAVTKVQKAAKETETSKTDGPLPTDLPPLTPGLPGLDLFSPTASDPSEPRPDLRDTPPPPDLGPDTGTGSFGRASRRQRGSVSYAEPNLRDKMRRPNKSLIDAVGTEERLRQAAANKDANSLAAEQDAGTRKIKQEDDETHLNWKTNPLHDSKSQQQREQAETTSPLGKKANPPAADLPASVRTDRGRRTSTLFRNDEGAAQARHASGAATAIAALSNATNRSKSQDVDLANKDDDPEQNPGLDLADRTSIFDFTNSSPENLEGGAKSQIEHRNAAKSMRVSRRHSSVPAVSDQGKASIKITRRKRETTLNTQDTESEAQKAERPELRQSKTVAMLETAAIDKAEPLGRGERAASRRRSMMI